MPRKTISDMFQRLAALKDEAENPDAKRLIEAIEIQASILDARLFQIEGFLKPNNRGASAIGKG